MHVPPCRRWRVVLAIAVLLAAPRAGGWSDASAGPWANINPGGGGAFTTIGAGPTGILICGADLSGAYRSLDQGATWERIGFEQGIRRTHVSAIGFDPADPQIIHLGTEVGLYRSTDGGGSFYRRIDTGYIGAVAHAGSDPNVVYAAYHPVFDSTATAVYRSADRGLTWAPASLALPESLRVLKLAVSPLDPNTVYMISGEDVFVEGRPKVLRSTDGGTSWAVIGDSLGTLWDLALDPLAQGTLYVTSYQGSPPASWSGTTWKSVDGGDSWVALAPHTGALQVRRDQPQTVRVIDVRRVSHDPESGVWESTDGGATWVRKSTMAGWGAGWQDLDWAYGGCAYGTAKALGEDLSDPDAIYWVSWQFPFGSRDGGLTFENLATTEIQPGRWRSRGIDNVTVTSVAASPADPGRLYIGFHDVGLWRSADGGASWESGNHPTLTGSWAGQGGHTTTLLADPDRAGVVWASMGGSEDSLRLVRSTQGGAPASWVATSGPPVGFVRGLSLDRSGSAEPRTLFVTVEGDVYRSQDDGMSWTLALECDSCRATAVDRFDGSLVYAGGEGGLWRSLDHGTPGTWARVGPQQFAGVNDRKVPDERWEGVHQILCDPGRPGWAYAAVHGPGRGLYRTTDRGGTWTRLLAANYMRDVAVDPIEGDILLAADSRPFKSASTVTGSAGLQRSTDGGQTWTTLNDGLVWPFAARILVDPADRNRLIVGTPGTGFFERTLTGDVVGVGPASAPDHPALSPAFPDPSLGAVAFTLRLPRAAEVEWSVHDLQGRKLWGGTQRYAAGIAILSWDAAHAEGPRPGAGIYFARFRVEGQTVTRRFALLH
jgi:photosystem II stability/assembly factor-like uncharacterized protein